MTQMDAEKRENNPQMTQIDTEEENDPQMTQIVADKN
jgi:hypothetical protein